VSPVQVFGDPDEHREDADDLPGSLVQRREIRVVLVREPLPVEQGDAGDDRDLGLVESQEFRVPDDVMAMGVVVAEGNEHPDVVEQNGVLEQFPFG
jgi:hypothetical protein